MERQDVLRTKIERIALLAYIVRFQACFHRGQFAQFSRPDFDDVDVLVCGKLYNFSNNEFGFLVLGLLWISSIN